MLTRVFLLLLAMMGLSAAQAAEGSRASQGAAVAAALASVTQEASKAAAVAKPRAHIAFLAPEFRLSNDSANPLGRPAPYVTATRLSDRQRT